MRLLSCFAASLMGVLIALPVMAAPQSADDTVRAIFQELSNDNLRGALTLVLPPEQMSKLRESWEREVMQGAGPSDADRAEFARVMAELTGPDAEDLLMAKFEPHFVEYETNMAPQQAMMAGMWQGFAIQAIDQETSLSAEDKEQYRKLAVAVSDWFARTNFGDRALARRAVREFVRAARAVDIQTLDQVRALSFEQALDKGSLFFAAYKRALALYGLDIDGILDSTQVSVVSAADGRTDLSIRVTAFGQAIRSTGSFVRLGNGWYAEELLNEFHPPAVISN